MQSRSPTQAEVLGMWLNSHSRNLRVCLPAEVQSYDLATQTVSVQPLVNEVALDADGNSFIELLPVISGVPVEFPGGGGMILTFPLQAGDTGRLIFADRSIDEWKTQGGGQAPNAQRRHDLTDAIFAPGLRSKNNARQSASGSTVTIGQDGAASDFAALAQKVLNELNSIASTFNGHTHIVAGTCPSGGGPLTAGTAAPPTSSMSPNSVASASLEVLG